MANTLSEVFEKVYVLLGEHSTSTTYPIIDVVSSINSYISKICKGQVVSLLNPQTRYRGGNLKFLEKNIYYANVAPQSTSVETTVGAITITTIATDFPSSGAFLLNGEIATYTNKSATQLLGVSGITAIHPSGDKINIVFPLPANISKPFQVYDTKGIEIDYQDFRYNDKSNYYTVMTQDGIDYIYFSGGNYNNILVKYYKKPVKLVYVTDDATEIDLPDDAGIEIVAPLVAGDFKFSMGEEIDLAQNNLTKGYTNLQEFYDNQSQKAVTYRKGINIVNHGFNNVRGFYNDTRDFRNV